MRIARTAATRGLRRSERHQLAHALKDVTEVRAYKRLQAVLLVATGRAVKEGAEVVGVREQTIYNWINAYLQGHAAEALSDAPRGGRPRVAP